MEHVLITGGAGYIGCVLTPMLLDRGCQVTVIDNLMYGAQGILPCFSHSNFEFLRGDVRDEEFMRNNVAQADVVIHLAAIVGYPACDKDPSLARQVNELATFSLVDMVSKNQLVIAASTGSNYGALKEGICTEETPLKPLSVYGETKTNAEKYVLDAENCSAVALRFATAFGFSPRLRLDLLINDFVFQVVKNNYVVVYEKSFMRTFLHVRDIAKAILFSMENRDEMLNNVYNVGSDEMNMSKEQIVLLLKEYRPDYYLHFAEVGTDKDKRDYVVSYEKIRKLGFETTVSIREGIEELLRVIDVVDLPRSIYSNV